MKFEMATGSIPGEYYMCDEQSPDSTRMCSRDDYARLLKGERVRFLDKEFGRDWADSMGIQALDPLNVYHQAEVASWDAPDDFKTEFLSRYTEAFVISTQYTPDEFYSAFLAD